jgi:hypothetical protein
MVKHARGIIRLAFILVLLSLAVQPALMRAFDKKLRVISDYTHVFLQPDDTSPVVDTLERGQVLSLIYSGKMKKTWYHICFKSEKTGMTKSGYVLDSDVEPLYDVLRTVTIAEESESRQANYAPRNFEEMKWGLSKKEVLEMEGKPSAQQKVKGLDIMLYEQKVINMDCLIEYIFAANKLSRTKFSFSGDYLDKNDYLADYQKIKEALIQKFGKPVEENMNWRDSSLKDDFSSWGEAVSLGHLELNSRWQTPHTEIMASLSGNSDAVALTVEYTGLELRELARKSQEE